MGGQQSTQKLSNNELVDKLNTIAADYILTQNFTDMKNLNEPAYCDKLILLTSEILDSHLTSTQIEYLAQKTNVSADTGTSTSKNKGKVEYLPKNELPQLNIKNKEERQVICNNLAKYYIKAAHIFSSIVTTIDPTWSMKDGSREKKIINLNEKAYVSPGSQLDVNDINLCSNRLTRLVRNSNLGDGNNEEIKVKPDICTMNLDRADFNRPVIAQQLYGRTGDYSQVGQDFGVKNLTQEPGIPELESLYYDIFDPTSGKYNKMSSKMEEAHKKDLQAFYTAFTGNKNMPSTVKSFSDISLKSYHDKPVCQPKTSTSTNPSQGTFLREYIGSKSERYFKEYADHIKKMMQTTNTNRDKLLSILDKLFIQEKTSLGKSKFVLNSKLDDKSLNELVNKTRDVIVNLYITCQEDFLKALDIFEKIIESQKIRITTLQNEQLQAALARNNIGTSAPQSQY